MKKLIIISIVASSLHIAIATPNLTDINQKISDVNGEIELITQELKKFKKSSSAHYRRSVCRNDLDNELVSQTPAIIEQQAKINKIESKISAIKRGLPKYYFEPQKKEGLIKSTFRYITGSRSQDDFWETHNQHCDDDSNKHKFFKSEADEKTYNEGMKQIKEANQHLINAEIELAKHKEQALECALESKKEQLKELLQVQQSHRQKREQENHEKLLAEATRHGLYGYKFGILEAVGEILDGEATFPVCSKRLLLSTQNDSMLTVSGVLDDYVVYSCFRYYDRGPLVQIAIRRTPEAFCPEGSRFPAGKKFKIDGKLDAETVLGAKKEVLLIKELK